MLGSSVNSVANLLVNEATATVLDKATESEDKTPEDAPEPLVKQNSEINSGAYSRLKRRLTLKQGNDQLGAIEPPAKKKQISTPKETTTISAKTQQTKNSFNTYVASRRGPKYAKHDADLPANLTAKPEVTLASTANATLAENSKFSGSFQ